MFGFGAVWVSKLRGFGSGLGPVGLSRVLRLRFRFEVGVLKGLLRVALRSGGTQALKA